MALKTRQLRRKKKKKKRDDVTIVVEVVLAEISKAVSYFLCF